MSRIELNLPKDVAAKGTTRTAETIRQTEAPRSSGTYGAGAPTESDKINVSDRAAAVGRLVSSLAQFSDVRPERIEALQTVIRDGAFNLPAQEIANAIIKDEALRFANR